MHMVHFCNDEHRCIAVVHSTRTHTNKQTRIDWYNRTSMQTNKQTSAYVGNVQHAQQIKWTNKQTNKNKHVTMIEGTKAQMHKANARLCTQSHSRTISITWTNAHVRTRTSTDNPKEHQRTQSGLVGKETNSTRTWTNKQQTTHKHGNASKQTTQTTQTSKQANKQTTKRMRAKQVITDMS